MNFFSRSSAERGPGGSVGGRERRSDSFEIRRFRGPSRYREQLERLRIVHLTDLHVGRVTPLPVHFEAVRITQDLSPDLVVITGDFVCHSQRYLAELEAVIAAFRLPVICVLGNHDYWCGATEVRQALERGGAEVLTNAWTNLRLGHQDLQIVGLDDAYTGHANRGRALNGLSSRKPTLGLSHIGEEAEGLWAGGVPLVLSGHTHAGQITVARLHELSIGKVAGHRYVHGLYGQRDAGASEGAVYVGAGVGSALIPWRVGDRAKREVTLFELGDAATDFVDDHAEQRPQAGRRPSRKTLLRRRHVVVRKAQRRQQSRRRHR